MSFSLLISEMWWEALLLEIGKVFLFVLGWINIFMYPVCMLNCFSHVQLIATPWTIAHQASLSMGFSRQENWSELPFPLPGIKPTLLRLLLWQVNSLPWAPLATAGAVLLFWFFFFVCLNKFCCFGRALTQKGGLWKVPF